MVGWDEFVVDDRIEERRGGRYTRSKCRPSSKSFPSLLLLLFFKIWFAHRTAFPSKNAELAEHDGFHRGAGTGGGRCWGEEEVKGNYGSCLGIHGVDIKVESQDLRQGEEPMSR